MNFNTIYTRVTAAQKANDPVAEALQYGKIVYLMVNFNPLDLGIQFSAIDGVPTEEPSFF
jgi:hypothetical protein